MTVYNHMCDVAFTVLSANPDEPTTAEMIKGLERRLANLKENPDEANEAFGVVDMYEDEDELPECIEINGRIFLVGDKTEEGIELFDMTTEIKTGETWSFHVETTSFFKVASPNDAREVKEFLEKKDK